MLEPFEKDLRRCAACHDQCMFATEEVFATGRQTLATSRKAMLLEAVRRGELGWTPSLVGVTYAGLSSGVQHAVCVHRGDPDGWPDETGYVRAARAEIVRAGMAPDWALAMREAWEATGNPYGLAGDEEVAEGEVIFLFDAATRAFQPAARVAWLTVAARLGVRAGQVAQGSSGFELFDLGFVDEARAAARALHARLAALAPRSVIGDSPEAVYLIRRVWPEWGLTLPGPVRHTSEWLADALRTRAIELPPSGPRLTFHDPACLARYLGVIDAPREALRRLGVELVEMLRHGEEAPPSGSYFGAAVGEWVRAIAAERVASAKAAGAEGIVTASPFDARNLRDGFPVMDLGELAAHRLAAA